MLQVFGRNIAVNEFIFVSLFYYAKNDHAFAR